jgi:hypothetical protein
MKALNPTILLAMVFLFLPDPFLRAQSMIDLSKEEVEEIVKKEHKEFRRDNSVVNQRFNYLKYVNGLRTRTWIIYFTQEDRCRSSKLICDYDEFDEVLDELNKLYVNAGDSQWYYLKNNDTIRVTLTRQEWYFTVREARIK